MWGMDKGRLLAAWPARGERPGGAAGRPGRNRYDGSGRATLRTALKTGSGALYGCDHDDTPL